MIEKGAINLWREFAPWRDEVQVEQDLVLSRALVELFQSKVVSETCSLRGGTALNKLIFRPALRYSEDIDLVQELPGPIGGVLDAIRGVLDPWLGKPRMDQSQRGSTLIWCRA